MNRDGENLPPRNWQFLRQLLLVGSACLMLSSLPLPGRSSPPQTTTPPVKVGQELTGDEIRLAEERLAALGYWTGPMDGVLDPASRQALIAFQKVEGRKPTGVLDRAELAAILMARPPQGREMHYPHIEVDLYKQVLLVIAVNGQVSHILPVSTGSGQVYVEDGKKRRAVTPTGKFTICRKISGWHKSKLGRLYYPNYICGGVAIHGSLSVPVTPQSHGCIRIPLFAAEAFSRITPIGTIVVVFDTRPAVAHP